MIEKPRTSPLSITITDGVRSGDLTCGVVSPHGARINGAASAPNHDMGHSNHATLSTRSLNTTPVSGLRNHSLTSGGGPIIGRVGFGVPGDGESAMGE